MGTKFLGEDGRRPGRFFFRKRGEQSYNISVVPIGGNLWLDNLRLRDFLKAHPDWARRYEAVKRQALIDSPESMLHYQDGKREFVDEVKQAAMIWDNNERRGRA